MMTETDDRRLPVVIQSFEEIRKNGGIAAAEKQIKNRQYASPFKADKHQVIAIAVELDDMGKGLVDWKAVVQKLKEVILERSVHLNFVC